MSSSSSFSYLTCTCISSSSDGGINMGANAAITVTGTTILVGRRNAYSNSAVLFHVTVVWHRLNTLFFMILLLLLADIY